MKNGIKSMVRFALLALLMTSCDSNRVYKSFEGTARLNWKKDNVFKYSPNLAEASKYNLIVELRHASSIKYGQLAVKIKHTLPSGEEEIKDYMLQLRNSSGELLGEAMGDLCDTPCLLEEGIDLEAGQHMYEIQHLMEEDDLSGILEVGLIIDKVVENQ